MSDENEKVRFSDLSAGLKTLVVLGWIMTGIYALFFLIGFIEGILLY